MAPIHKAAQIHLLPYGANSTPASRPTLLVLGYLCKPTCQIHYKKY